MNRKGLSQAGEYIVGRGIGFTAHVLPIVGIARIEQPENMIMRPTDSALFPVERKDGTGSVKYQVNAVSYVFALSS